MINPAIIGAATGTGIALGGSKVYQKVTGKPAGAPASIAHVLTNDKLDSKAATISEMTKEGVKDLLVLGGSAATVGGAAAIATGCSNKVGQAFSKGISKVGEHNININRMQVAQKSNKSDNVSIMIITTDRNVDDDTMKTINEIDGIKNAQYIKLNA